MSPASPRSAQQVLYSVVDDHGLIEVYQEDGRIELRFGNEIVQSAYSPQAPELLLLAYQRAMMGAFLFPHGRSQVLHVGLGGGDLPRYVHRYLPYVRQTCVELRAEVLQVARECFALPQDIQVHIQEGGAYLQACTECYALIFLDLYRNWGIDERLCETAFLRTVIDRLAPGGWLVINVWSSQHKQRDALCKNMLRELEGLWMIPAEFDGNEVLLASAGVSELPDASLLRSRAQALGERIPIDFLRILKRLHRLRYIPGLFGGVAASPCEVV